MKDSGHMISIVESLEPLMEDAFLVTLDVEALYTNVRNEGGIQVFCPNFLSQRPLDSKPSNSCIITSAEIVLIIFSYSRRIFSYRRKGWPWVLPWLKIMLACM